jgi:DNA repair protein RecO (recombination protein O)
MNVRYRTLGIVLRKRAKGEADYFFTIFTKDFGKLEILGKGIRKIASKLKSGMELFCLSEIEFIQGKTHKTLTDAILINNFPYLRKDLKKLTLSFRIARTVSRFTQKEDPDEKIWQFLNEIFQKLNNLKTKINNPNLLYYYFLWNFFSILGYEPQFSFCLSCRKRITQGPIYFKEEQGGLLCLDCAKKDASKPKAEIDLNLVKIIKLALKKNWNIFCRLKISPLNQKQLKEISQKFFSKIFI